MNEQSRGANSSGAMAVLLLLACLLLPVLYVLSIGPVVWLVEASGAGEDVATFVYAPLIWLHQSNESFRAMLDWYVSFWE